MNKITQLLTVSLLLCGAGVANAAPDLTAKAEEKIRDILDGMSYKQEGDQKTQDLVKQTLEKLISVWNAFAQCRQEEGKEVFSCAQREHKSALSDFGRCDRLDDDNSARISCDKANYFVAIAAAKSNFKINESNGVCSNLDGTLTEGDLPTK